MAHIPACAWSSQGLRVATVCRRMGRKDEEEQAHAEPDSLGRGRPSAVGSMFLRPTPRSSNSRIDRSAKTQRAPNHIFEMWLEL